MKRRKDQVTGERGLDRNFYRFLVTNFTKKNCVGILTQNRPESSGKGQSTLEVDLDLIHSRKLVFNGILDRDNILLRGKNFPDAGIECCGLSTPRRPGDQEHPVGLVDGLANIDQRFLFEVQGIQVQCQVARIQNTQHDFLAVNRGERRHTEVHLPSVDSELKFPVLGTTSLGDVQAGHDLDTTGDGAVHLLRRSDRFPTATVNAIPNPHKLLHRFDMDITRLTANAFEDDQVDKLDDRSLVLVISELQLVDVLFTRRLLDIHLRVVHVLEEIPNHLSALVVDLRNGLLDADIRGQNGANGAARNDLDIIQLENVEGVGDCQGQNISDLGNRDHLIIVRQVLRQELKDTLVR